MHTTLDADDAYDKQMKHTIVGYMSDTHTRLCLGLSTLRLVSIDDIEPRVTRVGCRHGPQGVVGPDGDRDLVDCVDEGETRIAVVRVQRVDPDEGCPRHRTFTHWFVPGSFQRNARRTARIHVVNKNSPDGAECLAELGWASPGDLIIVAAEVRVVALQIRLGRSCCEEVASVLHPVVALHN